MKEIRLPSLNELDGDALTELYRVPDSLHVRTNMVLSSDGYFVDVDGASRHFSSPEDMRIFNLLRSLSEVVLVGANTAVIDNYGQVKIRSEFLSNRSNPDDIPVVALVSKSLRIPFDARLFTMPGPSPLIYTMESDSPDWAMRRDKLSAISEVIVLDSDESSALQAFVTNIVRDLRSRGLNRVLCEGGPRLLEWMFAADLVTDIAATWSDQQSRFAIPNESPFPSEFISHSKISADGQMFEQLRRHSSS